MNIIFLDIDGVLATRATRFAGDHFDPECAKHLKEIIDRTDSYVVISSTWRYNRALWQFAALFDAVGIDGSRVLDVTPMSDKKRGSLYVSKSRGAEISEWLRHAGSKYRIGRYIVIDDDSDVQPHEKRWVKTDTYKGLSKENVEEAVRLLSGENALNLVGLK